MQKRKREIIKEFSDYRKDQLLDGRFTLIRDHGKFIDSHTIALLGGGILEADKFLICTGSVIKTPNLIGLAECSYKTSDDVLDLEQLPEECVVLGGGVVACELAQFLTRIGCRVIQLQRSSHILKEFAQESSEVVESAMRKEGVDLRTGVSLQSFENLGNERTLVNFEHQVPISFLGD